jgi:hypothetical protein
MRVMSLLTPFALLWSCNQYDLFQLSGYEQDSFSNQADVLFVIDNSSSMVDETTSLAMNFGSFIEDLSNREKDLGRQGLADAASAYIDYVQDRAAFVNYQFGITTTDVDSEAGALLARVQRGEPNVAENFLVGLLCDATCITNPTLLGDDPSYSCRDGGAPLSEQPELTRQYLDCKCGNAKDWLGNCGSAQEEALEAVFLAMCRAVENPPESCFEGVVMVDDAGDVTEWEPALTEEDRNSNEGLLRDGATFLPVIVTDEGDSSRREPEAAPFPDVYLELFSQFRQRIAWVVIGPGLVDMGGMYSTTCNSLGTGSSAFRYEFLVYDSNGLKVDITTPEPECETTDFKEALDRLGVLLQNLSTTFALSSVPVKDTIRAVIDGRPIEESKEDGLDELGLPVYTDGWTYRADENAVVFHGEAIPRADADVRVYYKPLDGMPRELPF